MHHVPGQQGTLHRVPGGLFLAGCCTLLAACGGSDGGAAGPPANIPSAAAVEAAAVRMHAASPAALHALEGRTLVTLNTVPPPPPGADSSAAGIVAVTQDAAGNLHLRQRDGGMRTVSPDGKLK